MADAARPTTVRAAVDQYRQRGEHTIRLKPGLKRPYEEGWPDRAPDGSDGFNEDDNVGLGNGQPIAEDRYTCDLDLDWPEAKAAAAKLALASDCIWGRASESWGHYGYTTETPLKSKQFKHVDAQGQESEVLKVMGSRSLTMAPPSVHPSGESIVFHNDGARGHFTSAAVLDNATQIAVTALIARFWPGTGARHSFGLNVTGALLRFGVDPLFVKPIMLTAMRIAQDPDPTDRANAITDTINRFKTNQSYESTIANEELAKTLRKWLGQRRSKQHRFLDEAELFARPAAPWLVQDLIVEGGFVQFVGQPGSFKTFAALGLALAVADDNQTEFLGRRVNAHGTVVYVVAEGIGRFKYRVMAWKAEHGVTAPLPVCYLDGAVNLRETDDMRTLVEEITGWSPRLVVFDTQSRNTPGADENSSKDMNEVIAACDALRTTIPTLTVVLVHHPRKDGTSERGHSNIRGALDGQFWFEVTDKTQGLVKFRADKVKDADGAVEIELKRKIIQLAETDPHSGQPITSCVLLLASAADLARSSAGLDRRILELVRNNPNVKKGEVSKSLGVQNETVKTAIDRLVSEGRLSQTTKGRSKLLNFVSFTIPQGNVPF